jgi:internalin A
MRVTLLLLAASAALPATDTSEWIARLGGKMSRDSAGNIVAVNLRGSWINDAEMMELARLPHLARLDLSHTRITDEGVLHLRSATKISDLNLYYAELITDQGMRAIRDWKHLKRLNVRGTRISDGTLAIVSRLTGLEALDIANTQVTDNGLDYLITLTSLKELAIGRSRLSDNALEVLRMLPTLTYLDLSGARAAPPDQARRRGEGGAMPESMLRAIAELKDLRTLKLGYSNISADGLSILSALEKLEKLGLEFCARIDDNAAAELAKWKGLRYVDLQETRVTPQGVESLGRAKPGLTILANPSVARKPF